LRVVRAHLLPGLWAPLRAQALALLPVLVVAETSLSYLGLGLKEPNSGLGGLIAQISLVEALSRPWLLAPLLFLAGLLVLLAANARGGRAGGGWETV
jgi:peptide/nickel transport system permease protein